MDLSIIIPVWNEEAKIAVDMRNLDTHFKHSPLDIELIIVDDGSSDHTVETITNSVQPGMGNRIIRNRHMGKGYAIRSGILASKGETVMFMDCGNNVPLHFIDKGLQLLKKSGSDIVLGTRYRPESTITFPMTRNRRITSALFRKITKMLLRLPREISDSQCGFKIFNGKTARGIFNEIETNGFLFDLELILKAKALGCKFIELPLEWRCDRDSRLSITSSLVPVIKDLLRLRKV